MTTSEQQEFFEASAHLLIECINNPQPIAFFSAARQMGAYPITAARPRWLGAHVIEETLGIGDFHHHFKGREATNYCTFVAKKSGDWMVTHADEQHREFSTLATLAQLTREKQITALDDLSRPMDGIQCCGIVFVYPVLVVEGLLFEVKQDTGGNINLQEVDQIRYVKAHLWRGNRRYCPIDIVTESFFPKLLQKIDMECRRTMKRMERRADEILEAARHEMPRGTEPIEDFLP